MKKVEHRLDEFDYIINNVTNFVLDHLRIISMQKGGDLKQVFSRLINVSIHNSVTSFLRSDLLYSCLRESAILKRNCHSLETTV